MRFGVPTLGPDVRTWANDMRAWLARHWDALTFKADNAQAGQDGLILWDTAGYPVVSKDGEWRQIVLADGYAFLMNTSDVTAAAIDTAYPIAWSTMPMASGVSVVSSSRVTFAEAGTYALGFSAQITSSTASLANVRFWPRFNGVDMDGSTIVESLHYNGSTSVVSRSAIFTVSAGDYLEAMWATDDTNAFLNAHAATAYAPAAPSVTLTVSRMRQ